MKSQVIVAPESMKAQVKLLCFKEREEQERVDVIKLWRLLAKLKPLHAATHPLRETVNVVQRFMRVAMAAVMCFNGISLPVFAADFVQPTDQYVTNPTITLAQSLAQQTSPTATTTAPQTTTDFLISSGPLSAPTLTDTAVVSATITPTYYVSATGSDTADGSIENPWNSISYAVSALKAGDTLVIKEGNYNVVAGAAFTTSGRSDAHITVKGEGNVILDGTNLYAYTPVFDTKGQSFIDFYDLTVNNARDAVEVSPGSTYVKVDGLRTDGNDFAVKINGAQNITVRNAYAVNSRNAFRVEGAASRNIVFENIETYGAKDIYAGYNLNYTNGDGFILEAGSNITLRNIISAYNWDGGFDIKANDVLVENVVAIGNKNNFKTWGSNIVIKSSLSYDAKRQLKPDGTTVDGNGINVRQGTTKLVNVTFVDNEDDDIKINGGATLQLQNSIIARRINNGGNILFNEGATFLEHNNVWYVAGKTAGTAFSGSPVSFNVSPDSKFTDPGFADWSNYNFRLTGTSSAIDFGNSSFSLSEFDLDGNLRTGGSEVDAGSYEHYPTTVIPNPVFIGLAEGQGVSGSIYVKPDLTVNPDTQSVAYSIDGISVGTTTTSPFMMGGSQGFDTKTLTNGPHVLSGTLTTPNGQKSFLINFSADNSVIVPPPPTACTTAICGVTDAQTVSGTVKIQPNLTLNPDIRKVSYYLNGTLSTREYASPFIWGGTGFDTTKLADGTYTLSGAYTTGTGDKNFSVTFIVKNNATADTTAPVISAVASSGVTSSGAAINWTTNEASDSQVEYRIQGSTAWLATSTNASLVLNHSVTLSGLSASAAYEYRVKSKDQSGNLAVQGTISTFTTAVPPPAACTTAICGVTDAQTVSGTVKIQPNLTLNPDIRKVSYYLNGTLSTREYASPFIWGGTGFDTTKLADGTYTLSGAYTTGTGDKNFTVTFTVKNSVIAPPPPTACTTAICGVTDAQTVSGTVKIQPNLTLNPDIRKVSYYLNGTLSTREYASPFIWGGTGFDTTKLKNGTYTLSGAYTTSTGDKTFSLTFTVNNTVPAPAPTPVPTVCTTAICGVSSSQVVSGTIFVQPNLTLNPDIRKVSYYLNGTLYERNYTSPFIWGGTAGIDTKKLANGTYTLSGSYTTAAGDVNFTITFTVKN